MSSDDTTARRVLLEEARTTTSQQLGQVDKIDAAAVRTVRITFLLLGLLAGGSQLPPFPNLGLFGVLGTWSLLGSLFAGLFVYGTSQLFVGSSLDELSVNYTGEAGGELTHVELLGEYEDGLRTNRKVLHLNGVVLAVSRSLLALSVALVVLGLVHHAAEPIGAVSTVQTFISRYELI